METLILILAGLLAAGVLVWQVVRKAKGKGCASCAAGCGCGAQKPADEQAAIFEDRKKD